jgi:hypothetical protein
MTFNLHWLGKETVSGNFGDILTPYILDFFNISYKYVGSWEDTDIVGCGSVARRARQDDIVLGAGILNRHENVNKFAKWWFVRGPLTAAKVKATGAYCSNTYGDPATMLPYIYEGSKVKKHEIGFVPQYQGYKKALQLHQNLNIINLITDDIEKTIDEITECKYIISSSLHGIIVAHAYGIPAAWVPTTVDIKGDGSKYADYFKGVNIKSFHMSSINEPEFINPPNYHPKNIMTKYQNLKYYAKA